jgi:hypothetical protein
LSGKENIINYLELQMVEMKERLAIAENERSKTFEKSIT